MQPTILVLGASGLLGSAAFRILSEKSDWHVFGAVRSQHARKFFCPELHARLLGGLDVLDDGALQQVMFELKPDIVINCVALTKGSKDSHDPLKLTEIYAILPHRLAVFCSLIGARLIHISTDGVFSGAKGNYTENDPPDALDSYGISKRLGEVIYPHSVTLRTSMIGHELQGANSLLEWFLAQEGQCRGHTHSVFSGLPSVVICEIIRDHIIPRPDLSGIYHLAAEPISKYDLLTLVAGIYGKTIEVIPDDKIVIDRSLVAGKFRQATGYKPPNWKQLIHTMHSKNQKSSDV